MAFDLIGGWNITNKDPIDSRFVISGSGERFLTEFSRVFAGLTTYSTSSFEYFILTDTASYTNSSAWSQILITNPGTNDLTLSGSLTASYDISASNEVEALFFNANSNYGYSINEGQVLSKITSPFNGIQIGNTILPLNLEGTSIYTDNPFTASIISASENLTVNEITASGKISSSNSAVLTNTLTVRQVNGGTSQVEIFSGVTGADNAYITVGGSTTLDFGVVPAGLAFNLQRNKLVFDSDASNTYIQADDSNPENLEIHVDNDLKLRAQNSVYVSSSLNTDFPITASNFVSASGNITAFQITASDSDSHIYHSGSSEIGITHRDNVSNHQVSMRKGELLLLDQEDPNETFSGFGLARLFMQNSGSSFQMRHLQDIVPGAGVAPYYDINIQFSTTGSARNFISGAGQYNQFGIGTKIPRAELDIVNPSGSEGYSLISTGSITTTGSLEASLISLSRNDNTEGQGKFIISPYSSQLGDQHSWNVTINNTESISYLGPAASSEPNSLKIGGNGFGDVEVVKIEAGGFGDNIGKIILGSDVTASRDALFKKNIILRDTATGDDQEIIINSLSDNNPFESYGAITFEGEAYTANWKIGSSGSQNTRGDFFISTASLFGTRQDGNGIMITSSNSSVGINAGTWDASHYLTVGGSVSASGHVSASDFIADQKLFAHNLDNWNTTDGDADDMQVLLIAPDGEIVKTGSYNDAGGGKSGDGTPGGSQNSIQFKSNATTFGGNDQIKIENSSIIVGANVAGGELTSGVFLSGSGGTQRSEMWIYDAGSNYLRFASGSPVANSGLDGYDVVLGGKDVGEYKNQFLITRLDNNDIYAADPYMALSASGDVETSQFLFRTPTKFTSSLFISTSLQNVAGAATLVVDPVTGKVHRTGSYGGGGSGIPGGSVGTIQYNDGGGSFGGSTNLFFNRSLTSPTVTLKGGNGGGNQATLLITASNAAQATLYLKSLRPQIRFADSDGTPDHYFYQRGTKLIISNVNSTTGPIAFTPSNGNISSSGDLTIAEISASGKIRISASSDSAQLNLESSLSQRLITQGVIGGNFALTYRDVNDDPRVALLITESQVSLTNRTPNGEVYIKASNSSGGGNANEITVAKFTDDTIDFYQPITSSGVISASTGISASEYHGDGSKLTNVVNTSGTPDNSQVALFSDSDTLTGSAGLVYSASQGALYVGSKDTKDGELIVQRKYASQNETYFIIDSSGGTSNFLLGRITIGGQAEIEHASTTLTVTGNVSASDGFTGSLDGTAATASTTNLLQSLTTNQSVGGIGSGEVFSAGSSMEEILRQLLISFIQSSLGTPLFKNDGSTVSTDDREVNSSFTVDQVTFTATANSPNGNFPHNLTVTASGADTGNFENDLTSETLGSSNTFDLDQNPYTINVTSISAGYQKSATLRIRAFDQDNSAVMTQTRSYTYIYPYYYGVSSTDLSTATGTSVEDESGINKVLARRSPTTKTHSIAASAEYIYFAYPTLYGDLSEILDGTNIDRLSSFTKYTLTLDGGNGWSSVSYNLYRSNTVTTISAQNYKFKF